MSDISKAAQDVLNERRRQVEKEGFTAEHDDHWDNTEMALAAMCYIEHGVFSVTKTLAFRYPADFKRTYWPWFERWWKPRSRRRNLVKAGALILAEIERLDRAAKRSHGGEDE